MERMTQTLSGAFQGMSLLASSFAFFIDTVFILRQASGYRLVVIHNKQVLTDRCYASVRGARIAFSRIYGWRSCHEDAATNWTIFYQPCQSWLTERVEYLSASSGKAASSVDI